MVTRVIIQKKETIGSTMGRGRARPSTHQNLSGLRLQSEAPGDILSTMGTTEGLVRAHGSKIRVEMSLEMVIQVWELGLKSHVAGPLQINYGIINISVLHPSKDEKERSRATMERNYRL